MSAPGGVEFFIDDGAPVAATDEDSVEFGQSQVPRWAIVFGGLAAVVVALAAQPQHRPAAVHSPELVTSSVSIVPPSATSGLGTPIPIDQATPSLELAVSVPLYLLPLGRLYKITDATAFGVSLDGSGFTRLGPAARLVLDTAANRVWVVDAPGGEIVEFDARNLHRLRTMHSNESIWDAAALHGHLYLARSTGLADVAPGAAQPRIIPELSGYVTSVAADPKRGRLLVLVLGNGASVRQLTVAGAVLDHKAPVPVGGGRLRVTTDGAIWLGGFRSSIDGAVVVRLDPKTLRLVVGSPVASRLGPSSWVEAAGDHDLWVRSAGNGEGLWCVDGRTGAILQYWPNVRGSVTSHDHAAFALTDGLLVPLVLQDCTG